MCLPDLVFVHVVVYFPHSPGRTAPYWLWPRETRLRSEWKDKANVPELLSALDVEVVSHNPNVARLWVLQAVLTPVASSTIKGFLWVGRCSRSLLDFSRKVQGPLLQRIRTTAWSEANINVVMLDHCQDNLELVQAIIALNTLRESGM